MGVPIPILYCALMVLIGFTASPVHAAAVTYNLDFVFSPLSGTGSPLGTVTLTELGTSVRFDIVNQAGAGSKLDSLYFNFANGMLNPNQLVFSNISVASNTYNTTLAPSTGAMIMTLKADGDGYFDGKFQYTGNNFLGNGQTLSFQLSATGQDLDVDNFHFFSLPGGGTGSFIMASQIQNVPGMTSGVWVDTIAAVPLPASALPFGSGLAGVVVARWRRMTTMWRVGGPIEMEKARV